MKDSVSHLFHNESRKISTMLDDTEPEQKYGRRTGHSQQDFIKEFYGHDVLKAKELDHERGIYTYSDKLRTTLKDKIMDSFKYKELEERAQYNQRYSYLPESEFHPEVI